MNFYEMDLYKRFKNNDTLKPMHQNQIFSLENVDMKMIDQA